MTRMAGIYGSSLLPPKMDANRDKLLLLLGAAFSQVAENRVQNFQLVRQAADQVASEFERIYTRNGLHSAPMFLDALKCRIRLFSPPADENAYLAFIYALFTEYQGRVSDHVRYRFKYGGNVHFEFAGATGMAKSSGAMGLADWIDPIEPDKLESHLAIDVTDLPGKLEGKKPGQTVILDEMLRTSGEGSRTNAGYLGNLDDTVRASQVNLFSCSPNVQGRSTTQATFELILWCPERKFSVFLVWVNGYPLGVVALPWARSPLWTRYQPFKAANVERTLKGQFRDNAMMAKAAVRVCENERFVAFLERAVNKLRLKDIEMGLEFYGPVMTTTQSERLASFMHNLFYGYDRLKPDLDFLWGIKTNKGLERLARKCQDT